METLNYAVLKKNGYTGYLLEQAPEKVLQFGEGNFLRAFTDYWFDLANEKAGWNGKCVLVKPRGSHGRESQIELLNRQQGLYTLYLRGNVAGEKIDCKRVISVVSRCLNPTDSPEDFQALMVLAESDHLEYVVSNTTEAGIVYDPGCQLSDTPCASFPGKLTQVLYRRYRAGKGGLTILPCELIDNNGRELLRCVRQYAHQWGLEPGFSDYLQEQCLFCSTLVDRIVPGGVQDPAERAAMEAENGYIDRCLDVGEVFGVWNIEGPRELAERLPFRAAGLNCPVVPDVAPYKKRKVRILNGAHTGFVLGAYLAGFDIVRDCMHDPVIWGFMRRMLHQEVIPTLPLDRQDLEEFAAAVEDRFDNPFVDHALLSISLNSTSKWRARVLPSLLDYVQQEGKLPPCITMSFAAYIAFYSTDIQALTDKGLVCRRPAGDSYTCSDDRWVLEFYYGHREDTDAQLVQAVMANRQMWGQDLTQVPGFREAVLRDLALLRSQGAKAAFAQCL